MYDNYPPAETVDVTLPPQNRMAEDSVLGSLLIDPDSIFDVIEFLKPNMFYNTVNRWVYEAILKVYNDDNPVDVLTVLEILKRTGKLDEVGGEPYLVGLVGAVPNSINCMSYARIVEEKYLRRRVISSAGNMASMAYDESLPISDVMDKTGAEVLAIGADVQSGEMENIRTVAYRYLEKLETVYENDGVMTGIQTGFHDLDRLINGLNDEDLIVVAARPGMGKSSLLGDFVMTAAKKENKKVGVFTLEMSNDSVFARMLSAESGVELGRMGQGKIEKHEWTQIHEAVARMSDMGIYFSDTPAISPMQLRSKCRRMKAEIGLDLIVVDYLQLMTGDHVNGSNRVNEVGEVSRGLKNLARELKVPVVAAAQLSRGVESRQDKRPMLSDLRESGSIEQDSDIVMFIYRDDYYNDDSDRPNIAELNIAKHRNGATATIDLYWNGRNTTFGNLRRAELDLNCESCNEEPWPVEVKVRKKKSRRDSGALDYSEMAEMMSVAGD